MDKKEKLIIAREVDPDDPSKKKTTPPGKKGWNEKDFDEVKTGEDLDIPGADLDDPMEEVGSEDEENNYYSIGGDRHHTLEED